jgi:hypothetical protein
MQPLFLPLRSRGRHLCAVRRYFDGLWGGRDNARYVRFPFTMATVVETSRARKGRNFSSDEERQVCRSVLHISQDPIQGNGQKKEAFWDRIATHYNQNRPTGGGHRPARSLETKWGAIKHDVAKFIGVYNQVLGCRESGTSPDDVVQKALELYKVKHPKQQCFVFIHYWQLLKDVPRWMETPTELRQRAAARASPSLSGWRSSATSPQAREQRNGPPTPPEDVEDDDEEVSLDTATQPGAAASRKRGRPCGSKMAKEEQRVAKQRDLAIRAQARATAEMAAANARKAQILQDQAALSLFTMPRDSDLADDAREYLQLRREEELTELRRRLVLKKAQAVREKAEAEREAEARAAEVAKATEKRVPPAPISPPTSPRQPSMESPTANAPETTFPSGGFDSQMVDGAGDTDCGDDDGGFVSGEGEFEEPQSGRERRFRVPFDDARRQRSSVDVVSETPPAVAGGEQSKFLLYFAHFFFPLILFSDRNCLGSCFAHEVRGSSLLHECCVCRPRSLSFSTTCRLTATTIVVFFLVFFLFFCQPLSTLCCP